MKVFDGGYNRVGTIRVELSKCDVCKNERTCIVTDASEMEYASAAICQPCTTTLFEGGEDKEMEDNDLRDEAMRLFKLEGEVDGA